MLIPGNTVFIHDAGGNKFPVAFIRPFTVALQRGVAPYYFTMLANPVGELDATSPNMIGYKNPVDIVFGAPDDSSRAIEFLTFKRWYITSSKVVDSKFVEYTLADCRWIGRYKKLTKSYNVKAYDDEYRSQSLNGGAEWTAFDAITDALKAYGLEVDTGHFKDTTLLAKKLPDNLSSRKGGGLFGSPMMEALPPMLESIRADLVPTKDGKVAIVDRTADSSAVFAERAYNEGAISAKQVHWQIPKTVRVVFGKRYGSRFEVVQTSSAATSAGGASEPVIENVCPDLDPENPTKEVSFTELVAYATETLGLTETQIEQRFMRPSLLNDNEYDAKTNEPGVVAPKLFSEGIVRKFWRTCWRVATDTQAEKDARRSFADINLGKLAADGTTKAAGGVAANYVFVRRFGMLDDPQASALTARFSKNIEFGEAAPFVAKWLDPRELIFTVDPDPTPQSIKSVFLGALSTDIRIMDNAAQAFWDGDGKVNLLCESAFEHNLQMYVYWNGLLVEQYGDVSPEHVIERPCVTGNAQPGEIDSVTIRVDDITANFVTFQELTSYQPFHESSIVNTLELEERADFVAQEVADTYKMRKAGVLIFQGVGMIARNKVQVSGDIYECSVLVGRTAPHTIELQYVVQPATRSPLTKPGMLYQPSEVM